MKGLGWLSALCFGSAFGARLHQTADAPKLDVGFSNFSRDLASRIAAEVDNATAQYGWPSRLRGNLSSQVVSMVQSHLNQELKPVKLSIAHTWVLFKPSDRDRFSNQVISSFKPCFHTAMGMLASECNLGVRFVSSELFPRYKAARKPALSDSQILTAGVKKVEAHLFEPACFTNPKFNRTDPMHNHTDTCIASPGSRLHTSLKNAEEFIGMSMKFEAGVMTFVQNNSTTVRAQGKSFRS